MTIRLLAAGAAQAQDCPALKVVLKNGTAPAPWVKGTAVTPGADGSVQLWLDKDEFKVMQKAGRTAGSAGLYQFVLDASEIKAELAVKDIVDFVTGLYNGKEDICVAFAAEEAVLQQADQYASIVRQVRDIAGSDSKTATPQGLLQDLFALCQEAVDARSDDCTLKTDIVCREDEEFERFTGLCAVGAASVHPAAFGEIEFIPESGPNPNGPDIALIGKGITFDSGGYDLKPPKFMSTMRTDKCGVVYMAGTLALAILMGLNKHVKCYLPCTENLVSGEAMLPGDILTYPDGQTVEIDNTDAEGRLILADALLKAQDDKAAFLIDAATLTGAAKVAVGRDFTSVLTPDNKLPEGLSERFAANEEELWPLPMRPYFARYLQSRRADMCNAGSGEGAPGASVAAAFLQKFVHADVPWVHFDLSAAYMQESSPYYAASMPTAAGVWSLAEFICSYGK